MCLLFSLAPQSSVLVSVAKVQGRVWLDCLILVCIWRAKKLMDSPRCMLGMGSAVPWLVRDLPFLSGHVPNWLLTVLFSWWLSPERTPPRLLPTKENIPCTAKSRVLLVQSLQKENYQTSTRVGEKQPRYFTASYENFQSIFLPCCFFFMSLSRALWYGHSCSQISSASFRGSFFSLLIVVPLVHLFSNSQILSLLCPLLFSLFCRFLSF